MKLYISVRSLGPALAGALFALGCASSETNVCPGTGRVCPPNTQCVSEGTECALSTCGDGQTDPGEECDDGKNDSLTDGVDECSATCTLKRCNNNRVDFGEACDPSVGDSGSTCNDTCTSDGTCGNNIHDAYMGEECDGTDLPKGFELYRCSDNCKLVECGNGTFEPEAGEQCDYSDEDDENKAHCNKDCTLSACGDGKIGPDELCDPGEDPDSPCESCSKIEGCGNGLLDDGEECDPAESADGLDACAPNCTWRGCGNGYVDQTGDFKEVCDDGNTTPGDGCSASCDSDEACGNGVLDRDFPQGEDDVRWEVCDDGNKEDGDSCSHDCQVSAACGNAQFDLGEDPGCDNGPAVDGEKGRTRETGDCDSDCTTRTCGDGIKNVTAGEECEPAAPGDTAACNGPGALRPDYSSVACKKPKCGDGYVNTAANEACEPLGPLDAAGDSPTCNGKNADNNSCQVATCGDRYINQAAGEICEPELGEDFDLVAAESRDCNGVTAPAALRCQPSTCGDGYTNATAGELCDDGPRDTADCNNSQAAKDLGVGCRPAVCGDGYVNVAAGEQCDGGPLEQGRDDWVGCNGPGAPGGLACQVQVCGDGYVHDDECGEADSATCNGTEAPPQLACRLQPVVCGDGYTNFAAQEDCDTLGGADTLTCNGSDGYAVACKVPQCGDGYVNQATVGGERIEECEPGTSTERWLGGGPTLERDLVCNEGPQVPEVLKCTLSRCGDGYTNPSARSHTGDPSGWVNDSTPVEQCDSGENDGPVGGNICNGAKAPVEVRCQISVCGDGYVNTAAGETCDPNATGWTPATCNGSEGGAAACRPTTCGDGYRNPAPGAEECDPTDASSPKPCNGPAAGPGLQCKLAECGDGFTNSDAGEECDPGQNDSASCNGPGAGLVACKASACGDGHRNQPAKEDCDKPGNSTECTKLCTTSFCGDGILNFGEQCEPTNNSTNRCDSNCRWLCQNNKWDWRSDSIAWEFESCPQHDCGGKTPEEYWAPGRPEPEPCDRTEPTWGRKEPNGPNLDENCTQQCTVSRCGDGIINEQAGEECELDWDDDAQAFVASATCNDMCKKIDVVADADAG